MLRLASPDLVLAGAAPAPVELVADSAAPTLAQRNERQVEPAVEGEAGEGVTRHAPTPELNDRPMASSTAALAPLPGESSPDVPDHGRGARAPDGTPNPPAETATSTPAEPVASARSSSAVERDSAEAEQWLRAKGPAGALLLTLAGSIASGDRPWDTALHRSGTRLAIRFPQGLVGLEGTPPQLLDTLARAGLLETDPLAPLRRVRDLDGVQCAVLTAEAARRVEALTRHPLVGEAKPAPAPVPSRPPARTQPPRTSQRPTTGDPVTTAARTLLTRVRARDPQLPGGVTEADGRLTVGPQAIAWFTDTEATGITRYRLLRALGRLPDCRIAPDGGLSVRKD
jgi:hypothetical protein